MISSNDSNSQFSITIYSITHSQFANLILIFILITLQIPYQIGRIQIFKLLEYCVECSILFTLLYHLHHYYSIAIPFQCFIGFNTFTTCNGFILTKTVFQYSG